MSSSLFHIARPQLPSETKTGLLPPLATEMALATVIMITVRMIMVKEMVNEMVTVMKTMLTSTETEMVKEMLTSTEHINGEENVELSGSATAAVSLHT